MFFKGFRFPSVPLVSRVGATPFSLGLVPLVSARYIKISTASVVPGEGLAAIAPHADSLAACETDAGNIYLYTHIHQYVNIHISIYLCMFVYIFRVKGALQLLSNRHM